MSFIGAVNVLSVESTRSPLYQAFRQLPGQSPH